MASVSETRIETHYWWLILLLALLMLLLSPRTIHG